MFDLGAEFLVFLERLDHLCQRAMFLGILRKADAVGDHRWVGQFGLQLLVTSQGFLKNAPHANNLSEKGTGRRLENYSFLAKAQRRNGQVTPGEEITDSRKCKARWVPSFS